MIKYTYMYLYIYTCIFKYLIIFTVHISQMFDATCPSTGSQWKAKVFFRGPLTTLPNDDFSTGTRVRATTSKSNVVELVQKDNMPFPFHGLPALAGCVAKSENLTIPAWLSLLASEKKQQLLHLDTPTSTTSIVHLANDLNNGKPRQRMIKYREGNGRNPVDGSEIRRENHLGWSKTL